MGSDSLVGRENCYTCQSCGKIFTTVDRDAGVTPFMVGHEEFEPNGTCSGDCYSAFYPSGPRPPRIPAPSHEWYRPSPEEAKKMSEAMQQHIAKGGLDL